MAYQSKNYLIYLLALLRLNEKSPPKSEMPSLIRYGYWGETTSVAEENSSIERIHFLCYIPLIKKEQIVSFITNMKDFLGSRSGLVRSPSLAEDAEQTLREMIVLETLLPGTALTERDLSQALGISRTPLRETIRLLASEGLVQYTPARLPFVADPPLDEINNCLRIQGALEALAGQLACAEASAQEIAKIAKINEGIVDTRNDDTRLSAFQADTQFHESIVKSRKIHQVQKHMPSIMPAYGACVFYPRSASPVAKAHSKNIMQSLRRWWHEKPTKPHLPYRHIWKLQKKNSVGDKRPRCNNGCNN